MKTNKVIMTGIGSYLPGPVIDNELLEDILQFPVKSFMEFFGIATRHFVVSPKTGEKIEDELGSTEMAARAAKDAIKFAGIDTDSIDLLITNTSTPDKRLPPFSVMVQDRLRIDNVKAIDIRGGCAAGIQAVFLAKVLIETGSANCALVCAAECPSPYYYAPLLRNKKPSHSDLINGLIFGDGGAACVLERQDIKNDDRSMFSMGYSNTVSRFPYEPHGYELDNNGSTKHNNKAIRKVLPEVVMAAQIDLEQGTNRSIIDNDVVILPQVNLSMINMVSTELERELIREKMFYIGDIVGNVPAPALLLALDHGIRENVVKPARSTVGILSIETTSWIYAVAELLP
jgi:3-oxoacyl-[acyl-carrier-protein] synthase-3